MALPLSVTADSDDGPPHDSAASDWQDAASVYDQWRALAQVQAELSRRS